MKISILFLAIVMWSPFNGFSQEPSKSETQEFIKSKLSYYLFDVYRKSSGVSNHKRYFEFDANCKLIILNEYDETNYNGHIHKNIQVTIDIADIVDIVNERGMLTINFKSNSKRDYNQETNTITQTTKVTQNTYVNFHTFVFDSTISPETIDRLVKAFKHLSTLCGNKTNLNLFK